jgi:hypothetical protein
VCYDCFPFLRSPLIWESWHRPSPREETLLRCRPPGGP